MPVTALFAALLAPLFFLLVLRVIGVRQSAKISLGDGGDPKFNRRIRVHANFTETVPYALILMGLAETLKAPALMLYAAGACLLLGRSLHAYGTSQSPDILAARAGGMVLTFAAIAIAAVACITLSLGVHF